MEDETTELLGLDPLEELYGGQLTSNNRTVRTIVDNAYGIRGLYHLVTVDAGEFNLDVSGFYLWLLEYLPYRTFQAPDYGRYLDRVRDQAYRQVNFALYDPDSHIGLTIRQLEAEWEAVSPGSGPDVYAAFIYLPLVDLLQISGGRLSIEGFHGKWERMTNDYGVARLRDPAANPDFARFLANDGFFEDFGTAGSNSEQPTSTPTTSSTDAGQPRPPLGGRIVDHRPLSEWSEKDNETGWVHQTTAGLEIGVYGIGDQRSVASLTETNDYTDIRASVSMRAISSPGNAYGCLAVRFNLEVGGYEFCIYGTGEVEAKYFFVDASGIWNSEVLLSRDLRKGVRPAQEWNDLEIAARGDDLWFVVNGHFLMVENSALRSGSVAIYVTNPTGQDAVYEFKDLYIRSLE